MNWTEKKKNIPNKSISTKNTPQETGTEEKEYKLPLPDYDNAQEEFFKEENLKIAEDILQNIDFNSINKIKVIDPMGEEALLLTFLARKGIEGTNFIQEFRNGMLNAFFHETTAIKVLGNILKPLIYNTTFG